MSAQLCSSPSASHTSCFRSTRPRRCPAASSLVRARRAACAPLCATSYKVEVLHKGETHILTVKDSESVLEVALDKGLDFPHDCKLGVCMTCPAKLVEGEVDIGGSMLTEDVVEKGYRLLCQAMPRSDCKIRTIEEDELLDLAIGSQ